MAQFFLDTFTEPGTGDVNLVNHTSDSGHNWLTSKTFALAVDADNDYFYGTAVANARVFPTVDLTPPSSDYSTEMDVTVLDTENFTITGPMLRMSGADDESQSGYGFCVDPNEQTVALYRYDSGSEFQIGTPYSVDLSTLPVTLTLKVQAEGSTIKGFLDGVERDSVSNETTYSSAGTIGLIRRAFTDYQNFTIDNYSADTLGPLLSVDDAGGDNAGYPGEQITINMTGDIGATQGTGSVVMHNAARTYSQALAVDTWDQGDGSSTGQIIATIPVTGLNGASDHELDVTTDGGSTATLAPFTLEAKPGYAFVALSSPKTDDSSILYQMTGTPVNGDQVEHSDAGNTTVNPDGTFTQTTTRNFDARLWDESDGTWGSWVTINVSEVGGDTIPPTVTSVSVPADGTYNQGQNLDFTVNWDEVVDVSGVPILTLDIGGVTANASYVGGTNSSALLFRYTIQDGDNDSNGIAVTGLTLNGGTIKDQASTPNNADLTLNSVGDTSAVLVDTFDFAVSIVSITTTETLPTVVGSVNDPNATISIRVTDGGVFDNTYSGTNTGSDWTASITDTLSTDTVYTVTVTATDQGANEVTDTASLFVIDETVQTQVGQFRELFR